MSKITIVAKIKVKEEFTVEVYSLLVNLHKNTHKKDHGFIQYDLHKNIDDKNSFVFIETWENNEFLDVHMQKEHFQLFLKNTKNKLENLDITKLEKLKIKN